MTVAEFINKVGFKVDESSVQKVNTTISDIKNTAMRMLGALGIGISLSQLNAIAEEFNGINDSINYAYRDLENTKDAQKDILKAANETKTSYASMARIVNTLHENNAEMFPLDEAIAFGSEVQKLLIASGKSEAEAAGLQRTVARVFQTGQVTSGVLRMLYTQSPALISQIAESMGVARDKMYELADSGQLTAQTLKEAIMKSSADIDLAFNGLDYSISDALLNIRNQWGFWVDDINSSLHLTQTIAQTMTKGFNSAVGVLNRVKDAFMLIADKLGGTENLVRLLGIAIGAAVIAMSIPKVLGFLKAVFSIFSLISAKTAAFVAIIMLVALVIDDIINFMKGNDSVIGYAFEKAGIDAELMRQKIRNIWENLKTFFAGIWASIKRIIQPVLDWIKKKMTEVFGDEMFAGLGNGIAAVIELFERLSKALANNTGLQDLIAKIIIAIPIVMGLVKVFQIGIVVFQAVAAFLTSPIGLVVAAIAVLIASGVFLYTHWEEVKSILLGIWETIKQKAIEVWTGIKDFFSAIWEAIGVTVATVWAAIQSAIETGISTVKAVWETVWSAVAGFFTDIWNSMLTSVGSTVGNISTTIQTGINTAIDWIKGLPSQAIQWGSDIINGIVTGIQGAMGGIVSAVGGVAGKITSFLHFSTPDEGPLAAYESWMPDFMRGLGSTMQNGSPVLISAVDYVTQQMSQRFQSGLQKIQQVTQQTMPTINGVMQSGMSQLLQILQATIPQAQRWGSDFMQGMLGGINSRMGELRSTIQNVASEAASYLHFSRPDKGPLADYETWMPDFMKGLASGIRSHAGVVTDAVKMLAGNMSAMTHVSAMTAAAARGNINNSRNVSQNVNINNTFNGDRAIQRNAEKAMDRSAENVTSELARGLAYAR